jgi:hypothetical protein
MNRWLKKCTQLIVRNRNVNQSSLVTDGSVVRINLFFSKSVLEFLEIRNLLEFLRH